ncbi:MAG TPA: hypothetical protein DDY65_01260, partial [Ruminococcaceae bacterium]|nr:hypothetical protein [Oscillospiraceae bacterium]
MAFDSDFEQRMSSALEEYRRSDSEMRMNAPGSEPAPRPEDNPRQTSEKKEAVDGSVEITFDPEGNTAN